MKEAVGLFTNLVAFDVETTGVEPGSRMIELAAQAFEPDGTVISEFVRLVNPGMPMPADASAVNGITDDMLKDAPDASTVLHDFLAWLPSNPTLVAHNAPFDVGVLAWEFCRASLPMFPAAVIDTLPIARGRKLTINNNLQTLVTHHRLVVSGDAHRALSDASACRQYLCFSGPLKAAVSVPFEDLVSFFYAGDLPGELADLPELVRIGGKLSFAYQAAKGEVTERTITPYGWATGKDGLMFHGMCHLRNERRTFRADRVIGLRGKLLPFGDHHG